MDHVKFKRLSDDATIPTKAHATDSGFDLYAAEDVVVQPGMAEIVPTNIAVQLPEGTEGQVRPRSGITAKTKLRVQLGTIDADYTGDIGVIVDNVSASQTPFTSYVYRDVGDGLIDAGSFREGTYYEIYKGDKIAQLVVQYIPQTVGAEVTEIDETVRSGNGFGSTGTSKEDL